MCGCVCVCVGVHDCGVDEGGDVFGGVYVVVGEGFD